jgi:23S rRNA (cytidine1920-2'-O)/16S rRNA (cytidine1409-2'-O)-methyltransferase
MPSKKAFGSRCTIATMPKRRRLDEELVVRGLADDLDLARRLVMAGQVRVEGQLAHGPDLRVASSDTVQVVEGGRYVSRGGYKLEAALRAFSIPAKGAVCADVGSSTGGFTDCLLQNGARRVFAIDSGRGQLHWSLRNDPRVVVMERTNARQLASLSEEVSIVVLDVSFISLKLLIPTIVHWMSRDAHLVALIKPQFEAAAAEVEPGGVVRSPKVQARVVSNVVAWADEQGLGVKGTIESPVKGPKGNREFLLWAIKGRGSEPAGKLLERLSGLNRHA